MYLRMYLVLSMFLYSSLLLGQGDEIFTLKSGDRITGTVVTEDVQFIEVLTSFGVVKILKSDLKLDVVEIHLKNGDHLKGELLERAEDGLKVITSVGELFIKSSLVDRILFESQTDSPTAYSETKIAPSDDRWYFSDERLMDIWFDPTGFALRKGEFYFSGLSWALGMSDRFQFSSRWINYFWGDLNIRPKITLLQLGGIESMTSLAFGGHLHTRGLPSKWEFADSARFDERFNSQNGAFDDGVAHSGWIKMGSVKDEYGEWEAPGSSELWLELFTALSVSQLNERERGRTNYTVGVSVVLYPGLDPMPRAYVGFDRDLRRNIKIMAEVYYDPYYAPFWQRMNDEEIDLPFFFDFGFMTNSLTRNKKLWIGVHFQEPFLSLYFKL